jgi:hypothetical protein
MTISNFNYAEKENILVLQPGREFIKILRWLKLCTGNRVDHPQLANVKVDFPYMVTTNGIGLHRAKFDEEKQDMFPVPDGLWDVRLITGSFVILEKTEDVRYPDYEKFFNRTRKAKPRKQADYYQVVLSISPMLLTRTLSICQKNGSYPTRAILMTMAGGPVHIEVENHFECDPLGEVELDAVLMLMHANHDYEKYTVDGGGLALVPMSDEEVK